MDLDAPIYAFDVGSHGVACAQVVRSIAPDAELSLVRVNGFTTFENAADWAVRHDVDVVSLSLSFFNESFYDGTGPFEPIVRKMVAAGILVVVSSGNYAAQHWSGPWRDVDGDGLLEFGDDEDLQLELGTPGRRTVYVNWDEHFSCGRSDLDVVALGPDGRIVGRGTATQDADGKTCSPVERVSVEASAAGTYRLQVVGRRVDPAYLHVDVIAMGGHFLDGDPLDSMTDPGSSPWSFTVGAVRAVDYAANDVEGFSSLGPGRAGVSKPDLAGPDGLSSDVYGARGFYGTSAAAPAVAATAALVLSRYPELTPNEAGERLKVWALREKASWDDPRWGAGKARLPPPEPEDRGCLGGSSAAVMALPLLALPWRRRRR
jgi:subtilisin family serine protease